MMMKAQMWSLDLAASLIIFFSAVIALVFAWNYMSAAIVQNQETDELQLKALTVSDSLIRTPGIPQDWNESNVISIGLADDDNLLNETKVQRFVNMSYDSARFLLDMSPYDFYFEVADINGTVYENTTVPVSNQSSILVPVERYVLYGGRISKVKLLIWG
jgi:hypothetical protein